MKIVKATANDAHRINSFFSETILSGDIELAVQKHKPDLGYRLLSDDHSTYLLVNDEEQVEAMATLVFKDGILFNEEQVIGYATDLRVANSRRAILSWSQHFLPILESEKQQRKCRYVFSVVSNLQKQAYNAFIRPRLTRRHLPRYHLFRPFELVSVHGLLPWAHAPLSTIQIRQGSASDATMIAEYLAQENLKKPMAFAITPEQVSARWEQWPNLSPQSFILAFDSQRRLIGCLAPWSVRNLQDLQVIAYHSRARVLYDSLRTLSWVRAGHRLPAPGENLNFKYLTHMAASNPDVMYSLIHAAFGQCSRVEFLLYPHFAGDLLTLPSRTWITAKIKAAIYLVQPPEANPPEVNFFQMNTPAPDFELPWM